MAKTPFAIGPFIGGMNNVLDPSAIDDAQCVSLVNFDILDNGNLRQRPPVLDWFRATGAIPADRSPDRCRILGFFVDKSTAFQYLISTDGRSLAIRQITDNPETANAYGRTGKKYTSAVQYDDKLWYVSQDEGTKGGSWAPLPGFVDVDDMPQGVTAVVYKERLFIGDASGRVRFSNAADFTKWDASDFFDISRGDGQDLVKLEVVSNQIVAFKTESTYTFSYDSAPTRAVIQPVSTTIGADNSECIVIKDGMMFVLHNAIVYAISNWRWEKLNRYIKFEENMAEFNANLALYDEWPVATQPDPPRAGAFSSLSSVGDRLIARYGRKYYVFNVALQAWCEWKFPADKLVSYFVQAPEADSRNVPYYFGCSYGEFYNGPLYIFYETIDTAIPGKTYAPYTCEIKTKMYDFELPYGFKRLFWWGADVYTKVTVNAWVRPVGSFQSVTWDQVVALGKTWDQMENERRTWGRPLEISVDVSDSASVEYAPGVRGYIRYIKSLRFRKVSFELNTTSTGKIDDSPFELFSLMALVADKQTAPKKIT